MEAAFFLVTWLVVNVLKQKARTHECRRQVTYMSLWL